MDRLPSEILSHIAQHIYWRTQFESALVSQRFYAAVTPVMWRHRFLGQDQPVISFCDALARSPHHVGRHVRVFDNNCEWTEMTLTAVIQHLPQLEKLRIVNGQGVSDQSFKHIARSCPHLTTLFLLDSPITDVAMMALGQHCKQLKHISLGRCPHLRTDFFLALADCPLKEIELSECNLMTTISSNHNNNNNNRGMEALVAQHRLKKLRFLDTKTPPLPIVDNQIATVWPAMHHLCLTSYQALANETQTILFLQSHPHLSMLRLEGGHLSDMTLDTIIQYLPQIAHVGLHGQTRVTAQGIRRLILACSQLTLVSLKGSGMVGTDFPEMTTLSRYQGDGFDRTEIENLFGDEIDIIRTMWKKKKTGSDT
ncbi:hypothetical protein BCR42DRAFT_421322 [Absidia repens]|uniref:F-box domain-containing protein n=1 Tax=Absidia repens TaxID=90262 RepID=A0A1X2I8D6_9FUNG|nr:hypothetical protein BCR42DRAFT_421322 [Absidia repens]